MIKFSDMPIGFEFIYENKFRGDLTFWRKLNNNTENNCICIFDINNKLNNKFGHVLSSVSYDELTIEKKAQLL